MLQRALLQWQLHSKEERFGVMPSNAVGLLHSGGGGLLEHEEACCLLAWVCEGMRRQTAHLLMHNYERFPCGLPDVGDSSSYTMSACC